jgi:hypothetical protein
MVWKLSLNEEWRQRLLEFWWGSVMQITNSKMDVKERSYEDGN